jgi:hypothetical protein
LRNTTIGPHIMFTRRTRLSRSVDAGTSQLITWPQLCTPRSVRPATTMSTAVRVMVLIVSVSTPTTVRTFALLATPWKPDPS